MSDIRLKLIQSPTLKCAVRPYFPGSVAGVSPISVSLIGNAYTISWSAASAGLVVGVNVQAWDADLDALASLAATGFAARIAANTWAQRSLTAPAAGLTITNPAGIAGNPTFALANDLAALEGLATTGLIARTAADTMVTRSITQPAAGIAVTNGDGVAGNPTLALANDLAALEALASNGFAERTGADTWQITGFTGTGNVVRAASPTISGTLTLSGGQAAFPATQNASADPNTLDDYEEGTWTPSLTFATPGNLSVTYSSQVGLYTKIGNIAMLDMVINTSAFTHTTAGGALLFNGAPFTSKNSAQHSASSWMWAGITKANYTHFLGNISANSSQIGGAMSGSGQALSGVTTADMPTGGTPLFRGTLVYPTA